MMTKTAAAEELTKEDAKCLALIDDHLAEIKAIRQDMARKRAAGRKVQASIDRSLKEIRAIIGRVQATH